MLARPSPSVRKPHLWNVGDGNFEKKKQLKYEINVEIRNLQFGVNQNSLILIFVTLKKHFKRNKFELNLRLECRFFSKKCKQT